MVEEASACNTSMVLLNKGQDRRLNDRAALVPHCWGRFKMASTGQEPPPVVMVDELLILNPHKLSFSEASMRIMITPHFSPRTRLSMAGRMVISEVLAKTHTHTHMVRELRASKGVVLQRQRLIQKKNQVDGGAEPRSNSLKRASSIGLENGGRGPSEDAESGGNPGAQMCQAEEEEDEDGIFSPVRIPGGCCARVKWVITWPLGILLYCTVPNCIRPRWHRWFMATFVASTLWIAVFSYLMVWMVRTALGPGQTCSQAVSLIVTDHFRTLQVTIISHTLDIPDYIMGITFLAAGTSVPDCMASLIVARQGKHPPSPLTPPVLPRWSFIPLLSLPVRHGRHGCVQLHREQHL